MDKELRLTEDEQRAVDGLKEKINYFAFINYLERNNESREKVYSKEEYQKFKALGESMSKDHKDSEQLMALIEQAGDLMGEAEEDGKFLYNGQESIDSDTLEKIARINYYTIIEMQRCGYSPDEIEYITYHWPY
ncbi:MAG: hypothetical protein LUH07_01745 [Lachnospiraceae bacterium]|nr:hypothetical protein [Lachnospiraceae bacterium]